MTEQRDTDRLIRAFLDEGRTELPDRAYDAVRAHIERTRQRVVIGPWREPRMTTIVRLGIAAAAVLLVAVAGVYVGSRRSDEIAVPPAPSTVTPTPMPTPLAYDWPAPLAAGTYATTLIWDVPFTTSFTVPPGWTGMDLEIRKDPTMLVGFLVVDDVYTDPCASLPLDPAPDGSIGALVDALSQSPGVIATPAAPVTFGGAIGRYLELEINADVPCGLAEFGLWHPTRERFRPGMPNGGSGPWPALYPHHSVWILAVAGTRYVIDAAWADGIGAADRMELQAVIDSIRIEAPASGRTGADCTATLSGGDGNPRPFATQPYEVAFGASTSDLLGPVPSPFPSPPGPLARVDYRLEGDGWGPTSDGPFGMGVDVAGPNGIEPWFTTRMLVGGFQGSILLDTAGTWLLETDGVDPACGHAFLIEVASR